MIPVTDVTVDTLRTVYETNVFGPMQIIHAMLPLLRRSSNPVIVNVGSGLGSISTVLDDSRIESKVPGLAYCSSKSALAMLTIQYAKALPGMRVNVVDPGYTATEFNNFSGPQTIAEGVEIIVKMATIDQRGPTATFKDRHGTVNW